MQRTGGTGDDLATANRDGRYYRSFGENGVVFIDRPLPFIVVYRCRSDALDAGFARLVRTQASYTVIPPPQEGAHTEAVQALNEAVQQVVHRFGSCLLVEVAPLDEEHEADDEVPYTLSHAFRLTAPENHALDHVLSELSTALKRVVLSTYVPTIHVGCMLRPSPTDLPPLQEYVQPWSADVQCILLEIAPVHQDELSGVSYPFILQELREKFSRALKKGLVVLEERPGPHYLSLGRRRLDDAVYEVDRALTAIDEAMAFLLQVTPINAVHAWTQFRESGFAEVPVFRYRPLPFDPVLVKRQLFSLPVDQIDDPSLEIVLREKQEELDRKIMMLQDRDSRRFFYGSLQLFGEIESELLHLSMELLNRLPPRDDNLETTDHLSAEDFAWMATQEFEKYATYYPEFPTTAEIRADLPGGLVVQEGKLLIGASTRIPVRRAEALVQHEVGTHMVTYFNGSVQPLRLLRAGLAGYETLQEGLAVLAEFLADGLDVPRLRVLAARVVAAERMVAGESFTEVFARMVDDHHFSDAVAWTLTMRTFRGGGFIKDVIYLRGLHQVVEYLREGGDLGRLFVAKIGLQHLSLIEELSHREILRKAPLTPRFLRSDHAAAGLERISSGLTFVDLLENSFS